MNFKKCRVWEFGNLGVWEFGSLEVWEFGTSDTELGPLRSKLIYTLSCYTSVQTSSHSIMEEYAVADGEIRVQFSVGTL